MQQAVCGACKEAHANNASHTVRLASFFFGDLVVFERAAALRIHSLDGNLSDLILPQCDCEPRFEAWLAAVLKESNVVAAVIVPDQPHIAFCEPEVRRSSQVCTQAPRLY